MGRVCYQQRYPAQFQNESSRSLGGGLTPADLPATPSFGTAAKVQLVYCLLTSNPLAKCNFFEQSAYKNETWILSKFRANLVFQKLNKYSGSCQNKETKKLNKLCLASLFDFQRIGLQADLTRPNQRSPDAKIDHDVRREQSDDVFPSELFNLDSWHLSRFKKKVNRTFGC